MRSNEGLRGDHRELPSTMKNIKKWGFRVVVKKDYEIKLLMQVCEHVCKQMCTHMLQPFRYKGSDGKGLNMTPSGFKKKKKPGPLEYLQII